MRRRNGTGTIKKLPGNRRRPWTVVGFVTDKEGKRSRQYLGYYETRQEAEQALMEMTATAGGLSGYTATIGDIHALWVREHYPRIQPSSQQNYDVAWDHMQDVADWKLNDHRISDFQAWFDRLETLDGLHYPQLRYVRVTLSLIYKHALKNDLARRNPAPLLVYPPLAQEWESREGKIITDEEQKTLLALLKGEGAAAIAARIYTILLYTGLRISELIQPETRWHLDAPVPYIEIQRSKTPAGVRDVPIHPACMPYVEWFRGYTPPVRIDPRAQPLTRDPDAIIVTTEGTRMGYSSYSGTYWPYVRDAMRAVSGTDHVTHDTRHTLITRLEALGTAPAVVRAIVGHAGTSVTDTTYTHITLQDCYDALSEVHYPVLEGT